MASFRGNESAAKGPFGASEMGAEPSAMGQVAMATDHGGRRGAPTGAPGQSRGGETCRAEGNGERKAPSGPNASAEGKEDCEEGDAVPYGMQDIQSDWWSKFYVMYCEMQHCTVLHVEGWTGQFRWSTPAPGSGSECGKHVAGVVKSKNCEKQLFWCLDEGLYTL